MSSFPELRHETTIILDDIHVVVTRKLAFKRLDEQLAVVIPCNHDPSVGDCHMSDLALLEDVFECLDESA